MKPRVHVRRDTGMRSSHETCPAKIVQDCAGRSLWSATNVSSVSTKKSGGKIVNSHRSFSRSRLCDGTCLMCQAMLERQLATGANHSCTRRHDVPDIFSHLGDSWPNAPTSLFGQTNPKRQASKASPCIQFKG